MEEDKETKGFVQVYKSTNTVPCEPWFAPADAEIAYPFVKDAPDPNFKAPMYDWNNYRWFDTDGKVQGQQLAEIAKQVNQLSNEVANGKVSDEALNQQLGTLVGLVSQGAIAQQTSSDKADSTANSDGGAK